MRPLALQCHSIYNIISTVRNKDLRPLIKILFFFLFLFKNDIIIKLILKMLGLFSGVIWFLNRSQTFEPHCTCTFKHKINKMSCLSTCPGFPFIVAELLIPFWGFTKQVSLSCDFTFSPSLFLSLLPQSEIPLLQESHIALEQSVIKHVQWRSLPNTSSNCPLCGVITA